MPAILYDLAVLAALLYVATLGSTVGTYAAAVAGLELFVSLALAVLLHEPIVAFLNPLVDDNFAFMLPEWLPLHAWILFLVFATLFWGTALLLWNFVHPRIIPAAAENVSQIDRAGGAVVGWFGGMLLVGAAMVSLSMLPVGLLQFPSRSMMLDVGSTALRAAGAFAGEKHDGRSVVLYGEPPSRGSVENAKLAHEPWYDSDGNGQTDDGDPYYDSDGNGRFTNDLYYLDLDSDGRRRVGLLEKYSAGRWDLALAVGDGRARPQPGGTPPANPPGAQPPKQPSANAQKLPGNGQQPAPGTPPKPGIKPPVLSGTKVAPQGDPPDEF